MVPATQRTCKTNNDYSTVTCSIEHTETILKEALQNLAEYYERNHLRSNPDKTQTCEFHLKNREANRKLNITWYNKHLEHIPNPVYLRVTLDRTLSYKEHIHKLKCKISVRNNILRMLSNTKWGAKPATIKTTSLAPGYSMAECACPVWKRSTQDSVFWAIRRRSLPHGWLCSSQKRVMSSQILVQPHTQTNTLQSYEVVTFVTNNKQTSIRSNHTHWVQLKCTQIKQRQYKPD